MPRPPVTPIEKTETTSPGRDKVVRESHPSFCLVGVSFVSGKTHLFESELEHQHFIRLTIQTCDRERDLHRSWLYGRKTLVEVDMSLAQWGAIVSSPNQGTGQPATLVRYHKIDELPNGQIPEAEWEPQLAHSHREVHEAGKHVLDKITRAFEEYQQAIDEKLGAKVIKERRHHLKCMIANGPGSMEFAAKSFTEHVEKVVTKARGDIETMVQHAALAGQPLQLADGGALADRLLGSGDSREVEAEIIEADD